MELRHLRYFVATAEAQNFTRAAAKLGMAQPPLSQQIRGLEREIGTPLFHRVGRGITLSEAGKVFLEQARGLLAGVDQAQDSARRAARGEIGMLTLGFTESASFSDTVTGTLRRYRQRYPGVEVALSEDDSESLIGKLRTGALDAAFVRPPFAADDSLSFTVVEEEPLWVALPAHHALAASRQLRLEDLRHERFILYSRKSGRGLSADIVAACRRGGFNPSIGLQAPQLSSAVNLVSAGMGIAVVPAALRRLRPAGVVYRRLALEWPRALLGLAVAATGRSSVVDNLLKLVAQAALPGPLATVRSTA